MISTIGQLLLAIVLPLTVCGVLVSLRNWRGRLTKEFGNIPHLLAILLTLTVGTLVIGYLQNDFSLSVVFRNSSRSLAFPFKIAALWGSSEGSLLFWSWILSLFTSFSVARARRERFAEIPLFIAILLFIQLFFMLLLFRQASPFQTIAPIPLDGRGLNPLLQNALMCIHPPMLLAGFVSMAIPFGFAMTALISGKFGSAWLLPARHGMMIGWLLLSIGNILGSLWAYAELGWGGFWAWDPVENAAILPWFAATAFLHGAIAQKQRGLFQGWNLFFALLAFFLTILGTYLNRSGVVQSVHAFSNDELGIWFLSFLSIISTTALALMIARRKLFMFKAAPTSIFSREHTFLLGNILWLLMTIAVLWGTIFPIASELITGQTMSVEPEFYNKLLAPFGVILLILMGSGSLLAWGRNPTRAVIRTFSLPLGAALLFALAVSLFGTAKPYPLGIFSFGIFAVTALAVEFSRSVASVRSERGLHLFPAIAYLLRVKGRRYGGYIIHLGAIAILIATAGAVFQKSTDVSLSYGESTTVDRYTIAFDQLWQTSDEHKETIWAFVNIKERDNGKVIKQLRPAYNFYRGSEAPTNEIAVWVQPFHDLYLVLGSYDGKAGWAEFRIMINPLMNFLWLGGILILVGSAMIFAARPEAPGVAIRVGCAMLLLLSPVAFGESPPPGMPATADGQLTGVLLEMKEGKESPLPHHRVILEVSHGEELLLTIPKETDQAGAFLFRFIDSTPGFSYRVRTEFAGKTFRTLPIVRRADEKTKEVRFVLGAETAAATTATPSAMVPVTQPLPLWPVWIALFLFAIIAAFFALAP